MQAPKKLPSSLEFGLVLTGFGASLLAYRYLFPGNFDVLSRAELLVGYLTSVLTFWIAVRLSSDMAPEQIFLRLLNEMRLGIGLNLVIQVLLNYFHVLTRSLFLILIGALFTGLLLAIARSLAPASVAARGGILIIGFDSIAQQLTRALHQPVLGYLGESSCQAPAGIVALGDCGRFADQVSRSRPAHILVASQECAARIPPSLLLGQRLRGVQVSTTPELYERLLRRIYCQGAQPADLLWSKTIYADSLTLAIQAVYTNLIGMALLVAASPLLAIVALAIALFSGPGPVVETAECAGFHRIPFRLMRFRTTRSDGSGELTAIGRLITRLHLVNLPRLFNIVRGEMSLVGPAPVRWEFARRLTELMPFYSIRFSVKPGILGWPRASLGPGSATVCEVSRLEFDLYYIKYASPLLDLEALFRVMTGSRPEAPSAEPLAATGG